MKKIVVSVVLSLLVMSTMAQTGVEDRMERDIQVAENVLGSLIKQQIGDNILMPVEVEGSYRPGLGITFSVPNNSLLNWANNCGWQIAHHSHCVQHQSRLSHSGS